MGHDIWEGELATCEAYRDFPELKVFGSNEDVENFSASALIELEETEDDETIVRGSPLLADQARAAINANVKVEGGGLQSSRCPVASIKGKDAVVAGRATVQSYSAYVVKLFDNFD